MMHWAEASEGAAYLAVVGSVEEAQAKRVGCSVGCLRVVVRVAAMRSSGAGVGVADLAAAGLGNANALRAVVGEAVAGGWLIRSGARLAGLDTTRAGRVVVREMLRAWERAKRQLGAFQPVGPFGTH